MRLQDLFNLGLSYKEGRFINNVLILNKSFSTNGKQKGLSLCFNDNVLLLWLPSLKKIDSFFI